MKKTICLILVLMLALGFAAMAEGSGISITTGRPTDKEATVMVAQMDNEPGARPQVGIGSADIVYEIELYRGGATRYTAVFNDNLPSQIEAIRSTRIVNATVFSEYGGAFMYYGARSVEGNSAVALMSSDEYNAVIGSSVRFNGIPEGVKDYKVDYDGCKYFVRDGHRVAPHNVIAKVDELYNLVDWSKITCSSPLKFNAEYTVPAGDDVASFGIDYGSKSYAPSYVWDADQNRWQRLYKGNPFVDGATGEQVYADNVIVQHVRSSWYGGSVDGPVVELIDTNTADYFVGGKHFTGTWTRNSLGENTVYFDADGNEVLLNPGVTFIQIFKDAEGNEITY